MKTEPEIVVIGEECKELVPIEVTCLLDRYSGKYFPKIDFIETPQRVELIAKNWKSEFDLIFAIPMHKIRSEGSLYLGHWNDGILKS